MSAKVKNFLTIGAFVLAALTCLMGIVQVFDIDFKKDLNPDNLLKYESYYDNQKKLKETEHGLKVSFKDDGSIVLRGKHDDPDLTENQRYENYFTSVILNAGVYTLSAGNEDANEDSFGVFAVVGGETLHVRDGKISFQVNSDNSTVVIGWFVRNGDYMLYEKLYPTLAAGEDVIGFYAED